MLRLALALLLLPIAAHALETPPVTTIHTTATLVTEADSTAPNHPIRIGLRLKIQPGWHTYWQNPGDAGAPPTIEVTGAPTGPITYPTPQILKDGPFTSYAYTNQILLPLTLTPTTTPLNLTVHATWLVCAQLCVPEEATFTLAIPAGTATPGPQAPLFAEADANTPRPNPFPITLNAAGTLSLRASGLAPRAAIFLPAEPGLFDQGAHQPLTTTQTGLTLQLKPLQNLPPDKPIAGILQLTDQSGRAEALQITANTITTPPPTLKLTDALLLAFLGGLILNLMPCVLPVLAIKAMALARLSGAARAHVRQDAGMYTAGVLAAFATIGALTLAVGAAGGAAGWGTQFQSAAFTAAMAWLMLGVALNFAGVFEIGTHVAGVGQGLAQRGSFFTGLLAVVVATPCTAPFMATALAAAVALPPAEGMAIFLALGLGLAAPYALLAAFPAMARLLPRPGAWMERLKQFLAIPMLATAAWMAWVVLQQAGPTGLAATLVGAALIAAAAVAWGRMQRGTPAWRMPALGALAACALVLSFIALRAPSAGAMALAPGAEKFTPARLATLRADHRPVLVDMSAAWCITCLVNERLALSPTRVRHAMAAHGVTYMVGDWTRQDPAITAFLTEYGRNGVPLYVYFPADGPPAVLPQILTEAEILGRIGA